MGCCWVGVLTSGMMIDGGDDMKGYDDASIAVESVRCSNGGYGLRFKVLKVDLGRNESRGRQKPSYLAYERRRAVTCMHIFLYIT